MPSWLTSTMLTLAGVLGVSCSNSDENGSNEASPSCSNVDTSSDPTNCGACGHTCAPVALVSGLSYPGSIAVDATSVYWTNGNEISGTVMRVPLAGGTPTTLASDQFNAGALAVNATSVYWTTNDTLGGPGSVMRLDKQACQSGVCK